MQAFLVVLHAQHIVGLALANEHGGALLARHRIEGDGNVGGLGHLGQPTQLACACPRASNRTHAPAVSHTSRNGPLFIRGRKISRFWCSCSSPIVEEPTEKVFWQALQR
jgi:hypothetical protein